jgi:hypothetical protein
MYRPQKLEKSNHESQVQDCEVFCCQEESENPVSRKWAEIDARPEKGAASSGRQL